jgi:hypothetical protein
MSGQWKVRDGVGRIVRTFSYFPSAVAYCRRSAETVTAPDGKVVFRAASERPGGPVPEREGAE